MDLYLGQYRFPLTLEQLIYLSKTCLNLILFLNAAYIVIHDISNNCHRVLTYFALPKYLQGCNATLLECIQLYYHSFQHVPPIYEIQTNFKRIIINFDAFCNEQILHEKVSYLIYNSIVSSVVTVVAIILALEFSKNTSQKSTLSYKNQFSN